MALRTQLLALGRTEGHLSELRNSVLDSTSTTELSIIEVLELWQRIFQDTFQQYYRLSTRLIQNEDRATALNLWRDYLMHVQLFLSESLPDDFVRLNEYRNVCEIHQNVLSSQQSVLSANRTDSTAAIDPSLINKFDDLSALHNNTLKRISDRHTEIELRLKLWNKYRHDHSNLLIWLKEKEHEKSRLQLRYIHLQRIPHILQVIKNMLTQIDQAQADFDGLRSQQADIIQFSSDSSMITSMRMEIGGIVQRVENLRASLETWKDFLDRITNISTSYNQKVADLQSQFQRTQNIICETSKASLHNVHQVETILAELRSQRVIISKLTPELESITVIQEELRECIYPNNIKTIRRTTHALWQQQAELDQQLTSLITNISERLTIYDTFTTKCDRLLQWIDDAERRLDNESCCILYDSEEILRRLEMDLQSEFKLRESEKERLLTIGRELLTFYATPNEQDHGHRLEIKKMLDTIVDRWERVKNLSKMRLNKIQELKMTMIRLEDRIAAARTWLHNVEMDLMKPIVFESADSESFEKVVQEQETMQRAIEKESGSIGEVLSLCEMVLNDVDTWKTHIDTTALSSAIDALDCRWKQICNASVERKQKIYTLWGLMLEMLTLADQLKPWVDEQERQLTGLEHGVGELSKRQAEQRINELENIIRVIENQQPQLTAMTRCYSKLVKSNRLEPTNIQELARPCKVLLIRYEKLIPHALDILGKLNKDMKTYQTFVNLHGKSVIGLSRLDAELTKVEHLSKADPKDKLQSIDILEHELKMLETDLASADQLGLVIMQRSDPSDIDPIQTMIDEYQLLWRDITTRITIIKTQLKRKDKDIDYVPSEVDSAVQVNTLPPSLNRTTSITPKDAYVHELRAALKECQDNLDQLEKEINNAQRKPGSQVVHKCCSNCQSNVELLHHLSNLLVTECFCSDEEAEVAEVTKVSSRYDALLTLWKSKEQQIENRYAFDTAFSLAFCFWLMVFLSSFR